MSNQPNILFIMTDQQHAGMMSCAGNLWLQTPAMDSLAASGTRFSNAYCTNPVCVPSRISMATGMMPNRLGASDNGRASEVESLPAEVDACSMGKVASAAGYDTFYGGKIHMCRSLNPLDAGYNEVFEDQRGALPGACLAFIRRERQRPFFAVASFINPHDICFAHRARNGINTHDVLTLHNQARELPLEELPPLPQNHAIPEKEPPCVRAGASTTAVTPSRTMRDEYGDRDWRINRWIYHRLTEQVDGHIGEILDGLRDAGLEENTLVIFTSDHGNMDASHRLASKGFFYEESVGVPLIIKGPGITPGRVDDEHLVSNGLDLLPTFIDYVGSEKPPHLIGTSLRPLVEGAQADGWRTYVAAENDWFRMIRGERFKYAVSHTPEGGEWLGDLQDDPGETRNLAADPAFRDDLQQHREWLAEWNAESNDHEGAAYTWSCA